MCWGLPGLIFQPKSLFLALNIYSQPLTGHFKVYVSEAPKLSNVPDINHKPESQAGEFGSLPQMWEAN